MYRLNGASGDKTGLGIALKVMTGDTVSIFGKSFWHSNGSGTSNSYTTVVNDLLTALAGTSAVANAGKGATAGSLTGSAVTPGDVSNLLSTEPTTSGRPNAYINWILFDEQFRVVSSNSGFDPVNSSADVLKTHSQSVNISKSGYLYVYVSNESNQDVFFDNLQVIHARGPLLEETHYYPFGLTMAGISSKAAGKLENKKNKFQGQEYNDDLGVDMYEFKYRMDDPQTGRFWQVDPLSDKYVYNSTYAFSENKVTSHVELEGLEAIKLNHMQQAALKENVQRDAKNLKRNLSEAAHVSVNTGMGVGFKGQVGFIKTEAKLTAAQLQFQANTGGQVDASGSVATANGSLSIGPASVKGGINGAAFQYKDGQTSVDVFSAGVKGGLASSKTVKEKEDSKLSQKVEINYLDVTMTVGVTAGPVGGEASLNLEKVGSAVVNMFKMAVDWMSEVIKEAAPKQPSAKDIPKPQSN